MDALVLASDAGVNAAVIDASAALVLFGGLLLTALWAWSLLS